MPRFALLAAAFLSLLITALSGFVVIPFLRRLHYGQTIKEIGPTWHSKKNGTPTMGGMTFILGSTLGIGLAFAALAFYQPEVLSSSWQQGNRSVAIALGFAFASGAIGFIDDYIKVVKKRNLGLSARAKIVLQLATTTLFLIALYYNGMLSTVVQLPFFGLVDFGWTFYPLSYLLIVGMVNAVNLTDGLDGLASSVTFVVMLGFLIIASLLNWYGLSLYAAALAGGCVGFLFWNFYPAKTFMGDTGSMFLGGAVTALAFCMGRPELLFFLGFVYICEAASVVIQVTYFKLTHGKRIFKMSPIHHHFEMCGWGEVKIDFAFSFAALVAVVLGLVYVYIN